MLLFSAENVQFIVNKGSHLVRMHEIIAGKRPSLVFAGFVYLVFILVLLVTVNKSPAMKAEAYNDGVLHPLPRTGDQRLTSRALCTIYTLSSTAVLRITTIPHQ